MKHVMIEMYKMFTWNKNTSVECEILLQQNDHWDDVLSMWTRPSIMNVNNIWHISNVVMAVLLQMNPFFITLFGHAGFPGGIHTPACFLWCHHFFHCPYFPSLHIFFLPLFSSSFPLFPWGRGGRWGREGAAAGFWFSDKARESQAASPWPFWTGMSTVFILFTSFQSLTVFFHSSMGTKTNLVTEAMMFKSAQFQYF